MPRPDETAKELQKRTKDAIEGIGLHFWVHFMTAFVKLV
jgi:hypothetical protein